MKVLLMSLNSKFIHTNLAIQSIKTYYETYFLTDKIELIIKEYTINNEMDSILRDLSKEKYTHIFVSAYIWNIESLSILFSNFRKINHVCKIIFGGPEVTYNSVEQIKKFDFLDAVISGEGEQIFSELLSNIVQLGNHEGFVKTRGVTYRSENDIIQNLPMPLIEPLDRIPFPYKNLEAFENRILYYESSRGCPYNCSYCLSSAVNGLRHLSINRVIEDLDFFLKHRVSQVKFVDRTFNALKTHALPILKYLIANDNGVTNFHFEVTATLLDDDYFDVLRMARPGLFQFEIGVQTTHQPTMHAIHRPIAFEKLKDICNALIQMGGIHLHLDLIAGLPYETFDRFLQSFDDVYLIGAEQLQLGFLKLLKGTLLYNERELHGYLVRSEAPYEVLSNQYITFDELSALKELEVLLEYYSNSGKFKHSLKYAMHKMNGSPSAFFLWFRSYFHKNGYYNAPIGTYRLYEIFYDAYSERFGESDLFKDLLKVDYYYSNLKGQKPLFNYIEIPNFNNSRINVLNEYLVNDSNFEKYRTLSAKQLLKNVEFITLKYDIMTLIQNNYEYELEKLSVVMFDYTDIHVNRMIDIDMNYFIETEKN